MKELVDAMLAKLRRGVDQQEQAGEDVRALRAQFAILDADTLTARAIERIRLYAQSKEQDVYSLQAAAGLVREAAALLTGSAETLEAVADPHAEVLKSAGINE